MIDLLRVLKMKILHNEQDGIYVALRHAVIYVQTIICKLADRPINIFLYKSTYELKSSVAAA